MTVFNELDATGRGRLSIRLAQDETDLRAVQRLRAKVFFSEFRRPEDLAAAEVLDCDRFDPLCDTLMVMASLPNGEEQVAGTYRLLRESIAQVAGGFYSENEFDLARIRGGTGRRAGELLELGRSCVLPEFRTSATISLLWRGIADYVAHHNIGLMFGCASFPGTDLQTHAPALSYLFHHHLAPFECRPRVHESCGADMERLARGTYDERRALMQLPPLVKGYLRAGAKFGDGAFIDRDFNSIDVCVVLPVELITNRYAARFGVAA